MSLDPKRCEQFELEISAEQAGERLDRLLGKLLRPLYSRSYLTALIKNGEVRLDGQVPRPSTRVEQGQRVHANLMLPAGTALQAESIPLTVVYEDKDLLAIDKPAGLMVHPPEGSHHPVGTLVNAALA